MYGMVNKNLEKNIMHYIKTTELKQNSHGNSTDKLLKSTASE